MAVKALFENKKYILLYFAFVAHNYILSEIETILFSFCVLKSKNILFDELTSTRKHKIYYKYL